MTRRAFLTSAGALSGAALVAWESGAARPPDQATAGLIDVNVNLGRLPLRRLPCDETRRLVAKLRARGVTQAWVGSFEGLLHKDLRAVNQRLVEDCQRHGHGLLRPFGSVDPRLPGWEQDLAHCAEALRMPGIRLHPNYHRYALDDPLFQRLLAQATERRLIVQLALVLEDERMMHPRLRVEPVDPAPLADRIRQTPGLRLVLLNALRTLRGDSLRRLLAAGEVWVEIAMLEGVGGVERLLEDVPVDRVLFGSHAPWFYFESAQLKLQESSLTPAQQRAIRHANARHLLA